MISIIIPCHNSSHTIEVCLSAILESDYTDYEIIVVDDYSNDNTRDIVRSFPCQLITLPEHRGAGFARNVGAQASHGSILFFTDSDCLIQKNSLQLIAESLAAESDNTIVGGTYTRLPYDKGFFSCFQSLFIHYAETKHSLDPDYIATHALAMRATLFRQHDGFNNHEFPILEDVEYSHRLKRRGVRLVINPKLQVQHIFNFSFLRSMLNAVRKTRFWTTYILQNHSLLTDSGTASHELKFNTLSFALTVMLLSLFIGTGNFLFIQMLCVVTVINLRINYNFLSTIYISQNTGFSLSATAYYLLIYPIAVTVGSVLGITRHVKQRYFVKETV